MFKNLFNSITNAIGLKESKAVSLSFEEARSRITDAEYRRLHDAFKRVVTQNSHIMSKAAFFREVLGDLFPVDIAEFLYVTCGGTTKGILFKDLVSALVVLTKGSYEEKVRFIFAFYAGDQNTIHKDDFLRILTDVESCPVRDNIHRLFSHGNSVDFDNFTRWIGENRSATSISSWLIGSDNFHPTISLSNGYGSNGFHLSDDHETPTFYQTLAGVTHLEEQDIIELEKRYWQLQSSSRSGKMDVATLSPLVSPPIPVSILQGFFDAFDENRDGHIDFKEMACGISAAARGPLIERQKFCFKIFDQDKDALLSPPELVKMVAVMKYVLAETLTDNPKDEIIAILTKDCDIIVAEVFDSAISSSATATCMSDAGITLEEYLVWSLSNPLPEVFLTLIYQVCQIVLGLKPLDPLEEYETVTSWVGREERRGLEEGQTWYLISMDWWNSWLNYTSPNPPAMSNSDSGVGSIAGVGASGGGASEISASTESRNSSGRSSGSSRNCWSFKKSNATNIVDNSVAMDVSQNVVVTAISSIGRPGASDPRYHEGQGDPLAVGAISSSSNHTTSASSLSLATMDSSRSTCSSSPSPINSPESVRRQLNGSQLQQLRIGGGGGGGSGGGGGIRRRKPGAIDNSHLLSPVQPTLARIQSLTNEGGRLRRDLLEGRDFKILPKSLWSALKQWYGVGIALPRQVISTEKSLELELHPLVVLLYRHQSSNVPTSKSPIPMAPLPWAGMAGAVGAAALSSTMSYVQNHNFMPPKRILTFTAAFSRRARISTVCETVFKSLHLNPENTRLDLLTPDDLSFCLVLEDERQSLEEAGVTDKANILIETRNKDQTWPEEIGSLAMTSNIHASGDVFRSRSTRALSVVILEKGLTGLNNLGNTCFMNSALQCVSNTRPLTLYFLNKMHMYELNRTNPIGMKGHIAKRYGDLIQELWSGTVKSIAPLKLRWTIGKYAPRFSGFTQNDAQELLAFLLDGLHEDLNRVTEKPYVELRDSNSRPDVVCAQEAWENHLLRNKSIVVDLFHGQLKSSVRCRQCNTESTRFDPFNYLTLPLPMESYILCDIVVVRENGSIPIRYGILAGIDDRISHVKAKLSLLTGTPVSPSSSTSRGSPISDGSNSPDPICIPPENLVITEIRSSRFLHIFSDNQKVKGAFNSRPIYAYEVNVPREGPGEGEGETESVGGEDRGQGQNGENKSLPPPPSPVVVETDQQIKRILTSAKNTHSATYQTLKPGVEIRNGPTHSRQSSYSSSCGGSMQTSYTEGSGSGSGAVSLSDDSYIVVVHRKILRQETYFLASRKASPVLFGMPLVVPYFEGMTHLELYKRVWSFVARLVSPLPPSEGPNISNHAYDCDDSLGYEYPFALRIVARNTETICGRCEWYKFCRGCTLACLENERLEKLNSAKSCLVIDWDPTALHLRYQMTQEFEHIEHPSLPDTSKRLSESVSLYSCLESYTKEEELSEEEKYLCAKCETLQLATKKLQIWRLPPVLIVHFKRFQHVQSRWVKSHKSVDFPFTNLNLTKYLADVPRRTAECGQNLKESLLNPEDKELHPLQDFHQHRLGDETNPFKLDYRLYAIVCHNGIMGGGHYLAYAKNHVNGKWYCFNDSSCREVTDSQIETSSAYMLFYERHGTCSEAYLPRIDPKAMPIVTDDELEAEENDMKKICVAF